MNPDPDISEKVAARMAELPKVVQDAIVSADVQKRLRELADIHKLHIDQWEVLENEVMLALLGFQAVDQLPTNIKKEVNVSEDVANALAADISKIVFEPIREELERQLEHPSAKAVLTTGVEDMRVSEMARHEAALVPEASPASAAPLAQPPQAAPAVPKVAPATPPAPAPTQKMERAPISDTYNAPSHERKAIEGDPYREQLQ